MKVYGDLKIGLEGLTVSQCIERLDEVQSPRWRRNPAMEEDIRRGGMEMYCFDFAPTPESAGVPAAHVWLAGDEQGTAVYVPNIIPIDKHELTPDEYNAVRDLFYDDIVSRAVDGRFVELSKVDLAIEDVMSPDTARALQVFSATANKSTGNSHPMDQKRWFDFIIHCYQHNDPVRSDFLSHWLTEQGWDEQHTRKLRSEFENEISLLRQYAAGN
jgi:hypothetical protein